jgi:hypothetical protein
MVSPALAMQATAGTNISLPFTRYHRLPLNGPTLVSSWGKRLSDEHVYAALVMAATVPVLLTLMVTDVGAAASTVVPPAAATTTAAMAHLTNSRLSKSTTPLKRHVV